jgi:hypothetical protein
MEVVLCLMSAAAAGPNERSGNRHFQGGGRNSKVGSGGVVGLGGGLRLLVMKGRHLADGDCCEFRDCRSGLGFSCRSAPIQRTLERDRSRMRRQDSEICHLRHKTHPRDKKVIRER